MVAADGTPAHLPSRLDEVGAYRYPGQHAPAETGPAAVQPTSPASRAMSMNPVRIRWVSPQMM